MGFLKNLYYDVVNIVSIVVNGAWSIWCYHMTAHPHTTYRYHDHKQLKLDFYPSSMHSDKPNPVILYAHGGGWAIGSRKNIPPAILAQLSRGYSIASISYSLIPKYRYPAAINDVKNAYQWLQDQHMILNIDPNRIVGWGLSAGAQLINSAAIQNDLFAGVISWYGFSDLVTEESNYFHPITRQLINRYCPKSEPNPNLTNRIKEETCSFYIVHGAQDSFVPVDQSERLYHALSRSNNPSRLKVYPNYYHGDWRLNYKSAQQEVNTFLDLVTKDNL